MTLHPPLKLRLIFPIFAFRLMSSSRRAIWGEARSRSARPVFCAEHTQGVPFSRKRSQSRDDSPIRRAIKTRSACPCANSATSPSAARDQVHSCTDLFGRITSLASIPQDQPARRDLVDLLGVSPSYLP